MKPWKTVDIFNEVDQKIMIQPTPEFDSIEMHIIDIVDKRDSGAFYINKEELPIIIESLLEMMKYITNKE